ncbi:DNA-binding Xre family transcriptional regulator [Halanaerobium saccharolyticum]|jgi:putative transcriptional regulator|uniref:DNA-binding Xre family transcriptional regulator n=1 Tax=Halanaerobium saccharolyticum TaxID=43595 RepID=A0A2T5RJA4_9FIRM|nr:helix-turn-helix transcriptional regulator [Halanaerobium saccharolyticum]PTV98621.1 DNA-binding Xre family transcriptional regulator [Halanaerobium saccharolyticum]
MIKLNIEKLLEKNNKSMYWLAENTDITYAAIYKIAKGNTEGIQFHTLEEIMLALDINDFNEIFKFIDDKDQQ